MQLDNTNKYFNDTIISLKKIMYCVSSNIVDIYLSTYVVSI